LGVQSCHPAVDQAEPALEGPRSLRLPVRARLWLVSHVPDVPRRLRVAGGLLLLLPSAGLLHHAIGRVLRVHVAAAVLGGKDKVYSSSSSGRLFSDVGTSGAILWRERSPLLSTYSPYLPIYW